VYANLNRGLRDRSVAGYATAGQAAVADGFRAVKCAPFDEVSSTRLDRSGVSRDVDLGVARVASLREAVGAEVDVMVDCHGRFSPSLARQVGRELEPLRLLWLEEPVCWSDDPQALARVGASLTTSLAAGEHAFGVQAFGRLISERSVGILMPDVKYCGGLGEAVKIAGAAEAAGISIAPHNPSGPVATLASVHLSASLSNFLILEFAYGEVPWRADLSRGAERFEDGELLVPEAPGLGVQLDDQVVARYGQRQARTLDQR
jgi:galactonate dehydratase